MNKLTEFLIYNITRVKELYLDKDLQELKDNFKVENITKVNNLFLNEWRDNLYNEESLSYLDDVFFLA